MAEETVQPWVFIGLGNPGSRYDMTRHNVGFMVLERLAERQGWQWKTDTRWPGHVASGSIAEANVHLLLPTTYMNNSGQAVQKFLHYHKKSPEQIVVISDDVALDFGDKRLRPLGSAGGHNGLKSLQNNLGTQNYPRLRVGVGQKHPHGELADYVLGKFTSEEQERLDALLTTLAETLELIACEGLEAAMNRTNAKVKTKQVRQESIPNSDTSAQEKKE